MSDQTTLTIDVLLDLMKQFKPVPQYLYAVNLKDLLTTLRILRQQGIRAKRILKRSEFELYADGRWLANLYVNCFNNFTGSGVIRIKKEALDFPRPELKFDTPYESPATWGFRFRR